MIMIYPCFVAIVSTLIMTLLIIFILPQFIEIFEQNNQKLPLITIFLLNIYNFFYNYYYFIFFIFFIFTSFIFFFLKSSLGKKIKSLIAVNFPFIKSVYKIYILIIFIKRLTLLLNSKVTILKSLETIITLENDFILKKKLLETCVKIKAGETLANSLKGSIFFTPTTLSMISIGEKNGFLLKMLFSIHDFSQNKFNEKIHLILTFMEPVLIIVLGLSVGFVVLGIYLPMFDMISLIN
ncbi:MAG: type II secretion system F family protein [Fusobacteriaceae bacterium]